MCRDDPARIRQNVGAASRATALVNARQLAAQLPKHGILSTRNQRELHVEEQVAMADDKSKVGKPDRNLISFKQKYEFDYAVGQLQKKFPNETKKEVKTALTEAARAVSPSEGREKIMRAASKKLRD
jgi:hypothetical protein